VFIDVDVGGEVGVDDHANVAAAELELADCLDESEGRVVAVALAVEEEEVDQSSSMLFELALAFPRPKTKLSKSSTSPFAASKSSAGPLVVGARLDMKSARLADEAFVADNSCSLRVCSASIRAERDLIKDMKAWNCERLSRGPKDMAQRIGRTSMARKSASAIFAISRKTSRAAVWFS